VASGRSRAESPRAQKILVIGDDENLRDTVSLMLEQEGFRTVLAAEGRAGFEQTLMLQPDLVLVDLRLPGMSGVEICKQLRASHVTTPIVVLSAVGDEIDKVLLLEIGADGYVVKPFVARELVARIRAVLRRSTAESRKVLHVGEIEVDLERRLVTHGDHEIRLTPPPNTTCWPSSSIIRTGLSRGRRFSTRSGATALRPTPAPSTRTFSSCGRNWKRTPTSRATS
jgi:CheY-like chemotaxis protein